MRDDLCELGVKAAQEGMANGTFTARDLVESIIARYHAKNAEIGAYLTFDEEQARALADANPTAVPIAIKDLINVRGQPCTCASKILKGYVSPYDATVVRNLKAHGFIPCGRVNMDEFAMGSSTENSGLGVTRNPYDLTRVPGGSSGGSAAAVGGNMCIAALGTDTGGSIRQPASFCNCVGIKPSYGRVSRFGVTAFASSLDQVGPMTKSVEDAAILLKALAGHDEMDGTTPRDPVPDYVKALEGASMKGVRIGLPKEYLQVAGLDPEVKRIVEAAIRKCAAAGAELVEVSLPHTEYAMAVYYIIAPAEASANLARFDGVRYGHRSAAAKDVFTLYTRSRAEGFGPEVKRRIIMGTYVLSSGYYDAYYGKAQKVRTLIKRDFDEVFRKVDVLMTPCAPTPAFKFGEVQDPLTMYLNDLFTIPSALAGVCAASVPAGFTTDLLLPVGVQLVCGGFAEERLLRIAKAFEDVMKSEVCGCHCKEKQQ
ncbi:MAG: Asp-tRNA(Asn)/Glu-tRNA(Gln) amidotransferase subunit GatA [Kiritimatiellia bacterium]